MSLHAFASEDDSGSNKEKPESNEKNPKSNKGNRGGNNNKKSNKGGGPKHKKGKSRTNLPSTANKQTKGRKKPPIDSSKQKKREIMEQIKAKIKEEGEEKKRKQNQNQEPKNQQQNRSKPKKSQPKESRLQKLEDEDPGLFDDDGNNLDQDTPAKRKNIFMNPFEAGKSFRDTLQNLSTLGRGLQLPKETKDKYFLDDRLLDGDEPGGRPSGAYFSGSSLLQSNFNNKIGNSLLQDYAAAEALAPSAYIPEVLVVGATGEVGRLVVRRLLLEGSGRFRVRVLVRDLYSQTLNLLGTGVSYCQGDLNNVESLEYALTDVDKIVYVAGAPKPDETDFQQKFRWYLEENNVQLSSSSPTQDTTNNNNIASNALDDLEWEQLASVLDVRSELAEQVDCIGMKNLVSAYQHVRHTDYGTSQAAKRSLFKFSKNSADFDLFSLDDDDNKEENSEEADDSSNDTASSGSSYSYEDAEHNDEDQYDNDYDYSNEYEKYEDDFGSNFDDENYGLELESRDANVVKSQVRWLRNKFDNGVFVGRVPSADASNPVSNPGGEASVISSRLQTREDPNSGIDMSSFAGLILRVVSDGNNYEAFVRTELYETDGIEYVYEFSTNSKNPTADNKSRKRFKTIRLAFENFKAVQRKKSSKTTSGEGTEGNNGDEEQNEEILTVPPFFGSDVRYLGFRFRSSSNIQDDESNSIQKRLDRLSWKKSDRDTDYQRFYMALAYIKVYRAQPEPEFIYLSDARIPPVIRDEMIHHQRKVLLTDNDNVISSHSAKKNRGSESATSEAKPASGPTSSDDGTTLLDEKDLQRKSMLERSPEETYFKYRGEEILIKSGLSYTIIRVAGFNELPTSEASTIDLVQSNSDSQIVPVSRAEVAQVCVSALLDPCALNKCVYMTKKSVTGKNVLDEEDISAKFEGIPTDVLL